MKLDIVSMRPFIGSKDFAISRAFYTELGFTESVISHNVSVFRMDNFSFYLQDYYNQDWIDNTMLFFEVENVEICYEDLKALRLPDKYDGAKLTPIRRESWGAECFLHDPSGVLLHFGVFSKT